MPVEVGGGELINRNAPYGGSDLLTSSIMYTRLPWIEEAGSIMQARRQPRRRAMAVVDGGGAHGVLGGRGLGATRGSRIKGKKYFSEHELFRELFQNSRVSHPTPWPPR